MKDCIKTVNLTAGYGNKKVLNDVNLNIKRGQITTIIGPNGCGKSTLLKTILNQLKPLEGAVYISGDNIKSLDRNTLSKKLAMVMTARSHAKYYTCEEFVAMGRYPYTNFFGSLTDEDYKKVDMAFDFLGASELKKLEYESLSDGQKQRIILARAIAQESEILILDEPTSYLDIRYKLEIIKSLKKLAVQKNTAIIMSLHELELTRAVSDVIITIKDNHVDKIGTPKEIFKDGYIQTLYDIAIDDFDEKTGMMRIPRWE